MLLSIYITLRFFALISEQTTVSSWNENESARVVASYWSCV